MAFWYFRQHGLWGYFGKCLHESLPRPQIIHFAGLELEMLASRGCKYANNNSLSLALRKLDDQCKRKTRLNRVARKEENRKAVESFSKYIGAKLVRLVLARLQRAGLIAGAATLEPALAYALRHTRTHNALKRAEQPHVHYQASRDGQVCRFHAP